MRHALRSAVKSAVVFSGRNALDFQELRGEVLRIPEVTLRVRQAQSVLDELGHSDTDLLNYIASDDETFFRNINLKGLVAAIVQIGLYDRFLKNQSRRPDFLVGNSNGDSALAACTGQISFRELVERSQALDTMRPSEKVISLGAEPAPLLTGISLPEFQAFEMKVDDLGEVQFSAVREGRMDLKKIASTLHDEFGVMRFINIGPANSLKGADFSSFESDEIETLDSIELDPMLSWFWRSMRPQSFAMAQ